MNDVAKKYVLMKLDADFLERKLIHCTKGKFLVVGILWPSATRHYHPAISNTLKLVEKLINKPRNFYPNILRNAKLRSFGTY